MQYVAARSYMGRHTGTHASTSAARVGRAGAQPTSTALVCRRAASPAPSVPSPLPAAGDAAHRTPTQVSSQPKLRLTLPTKTTATSAQLASAVHSCIPSAGPVTTPLCVRCACEGGHGGRHRVAVFLARHGTSRCGWVQANTHATCTCANMAGGGGRGITPAFASGCMQATAQGPPWLHKRRGAPYMMQLTYVSYVGLALASHLPFIYVAQAQATHVTLCLCRRHHFWAGAGGMGA